MRAKENSADLVLSDGLHLPTIRAMLDLLVVDYTNRGFYYNEANDYGIVEFRWHSGKGDPFKRFAGEAVTSDFCTATGGTEVHKTGDYRLNDKAVTAMMRSIKALRKRQLKSGKSKQKR